MIKENIMKTIKRFGFMSWYAVICMVVITTVLDYYVVSTWNELGGFDAWRSANSMWDCALAYLFVWHFFMCCGMWLVWICNEE